MGRKPCKSGIYADSYVCWQITHLRNYVVSRQALETASNVIAEKGQRPAGDQDPLAATAKQTYTIEELGALCRNLGSNQDIASARDLSMLLFMHCSAGRSDSVRLVHLADFCPPIHLKHICASTAPSSVSPVFAVSHQKHAAYLAWQKPACVLAFEQQLCMLHASLHDSHACHAYNQSFLLQAQHAFATP